MIKIVYFFKNTIKQYEEYKIKSINLYIEANYPYDNFFIKIKCKNFEVFVEKNVIL